MTGDVESMKIMMEKRGKMEAAGRKKTRIRGTNGKLCAER